MTGKYEYDYPMQTVTADMVVIKKFGPMDYRLLLIRRAKEPFIGMYAFPGGHLDEGETTEECAVRELKEETGLVIEDPVLLGVFSKPGRDPRGRYISVAYIDMLDEDDEQEVNGMDDADDAVWIDMLDDRRLAFDHNLIFAHALAWLAPKV